MIKHIHLIFLILLFSCDLDQSEENQKNTVIPVIPEISDIITSESNWTDNAVTVTPSWEKKEGLVCYYRINDGAWVAGENAVIIENCTVFFRIGDSSDTFSKEKMIIITNIDNVKPKVTSVISSNLKLTAENINLTPKGDDKESGFSHILMKQEDERWVTGLSNVLTKQEDGTWINQTNFLCSENGIYSFVAVDNVGNISEIFNYVVDNIDKTLPFISGITVDPPDWTNDSVKLTVNSETAVVYQYKTENEWFVGNSITLNSNGIVQFKIQNSYGTWSEIKEYEVQTIDNIKPVINSLTPSKTIITPDDITITCVGSDLGNSGIDRYQYRLSEVDYWIDANTVTIAENTSIYFRIIDNAGNISEVKDIIISNIDKTLPSINEIILEPDTWTNNDVKLTFFSNNAEYYQYKQDNVWINGDSLTLTENCFLTLRIQNILGTWSDEVEYNIANIDKIIPNISSITSSNKELTSEDITIICEGVDEGGSGISTYQYLISPDQNWTDGKTITLEKNSTVKFRIIDNAGNISQEEEIIVTNIDKISPTITSITSSNTQFTPEDIILSCTGNDTGGSGINKYQYKFFGDNNWIDGRHVTVTNNTIVYFHLLDIAGNISIPHQIAITNIDKDFTLKPPNELSADINQNVVIISWAIEDPSDIFQIYRQDGSALPIAISNFTLTRSGFIDENYPEDIPFKYYIKARRGDFISDLSLSSNQITLSALEIEASKLIYNNKIEISWFQNSQAQSYNLYRYDRQDDLTFSMKMELPSTAYNYSDTNVEINKIYYYRVTWIKEGIEYGLNSNMVIGLYSENIDYYEPNNDYSHLLDQNGFSIPMQEGQYFYSMDEGSGNRAEDIDWYKFINQDFSLVNIHFPQGSPFISETIKYKFLYKGKIYSGEKRIFSTDVSISLPENIEQDQPVYLMVAPQVDNGNLIGQYKISFGL